MAQSNPLDVTGGRYNSLTAQRINVIGSDMHVEVIRKTLQPLHFVQVKAPKALQDVDQTANFLVIAADFTNLPALQALARFVISIPHFSGEKIIFATNPPHLSNEELLFGVELDIKFTFFGLRRDDELKEFIKRQAVEQTQAGSIAFIDAEVQKALLRNDAKAMTYWIERLNKMDKRSESVNRLMAIIYESKADTKRTVFHLKQTLAANPLNLWAANKLGSHYLMTGQPAEGIAILKKLSRFHELNAERMLVLGTAYLNSGDVIQAESTLHLGNQLSGGQDERFSESLAKLDMLKGEPSRALEKIGKKFLSHSILSFLNTRAVMAVRNGQMDEGLNLYKQAIHGCDPREKVVQAKIFFNQGLAEVRNHQPEFAEKSFMQSLELGGKDFDRASQPLSIARQLVAKQKKTSVVANTKVSPETFKSIDDFDFESAE